MEGGVVDIVIICEECCWDVVIDDFFNWGFLFNRVVYVINIDIKDNYEEVFVGGKVMVDFVDFLN